MPKISSEPQPQPIDLIDPVEAAAILGKSVGTLRNWRHAGLNLPFGRVGLPHSRVVYKRADVEAYKAARKIKWVNVVEVAA